ncbi:hypothetical protein GGF32_006923 [Allomyces javanicus]|nr:hypothetical protein GGF32_006923 [Allomyces javanicus]
MMYAPHLYEACRAYARDNGMAELAWPDMEAFTDLYGREHLFAGRAPDTPEERLTSWYLMAGASVTTPLPSHLIGRSTRSKHYLRFARGVERHLKARSYAGLIFRDRDMVKDLVLPGTPFERSKKVLDTIHRGIADQLESGTVSPAFCTRTLN